MCISMCRYQSFVVMNLKPLNQEQQRATIMHQLHESSVYDQLSELASAAGAIFGQRGQGNGQGAVATSDARGVAGSMHVQTQSCSCVHVCTCGAQEHE